MLQRNETDLIKSWKINIPATLAGRVEYMLISPVHQRPIYGARARLIEKLLEHWVAVESGNPEPPPLPTLEQLRSIE